MIIEGDVLDKKTHPLVSECPNSPDQQGQCCPNTSHTTKGHKCIPHCWFWVCQPKELHKAILWRQRGEAVRGNLESETKGQRPVLVGQFIAQWLQLCNHVFLHPATQPLVITYPWVVFEQPFSLFRQQVWGDFLPHQLHTVRPVPLLQVLTHRGGEGQQAGDAAPVCRPVWEETSGYRADNTHVVACVLKFVDHT